MVARRGVSEAGLMATGLRSTGQEDGHTSIDFTITSPPPTSVRVETLDPALWKIPWLTACCFHSILDHGNQSQFLGASRFGTSQLLVLKSWIPNSNCRHQFHGQIQSRNNWAPELAATLLARCKKHRNTHLGPVSSHLVIKEGSLINSPHKKFPRILWEKKILKAGMQDPVFLLPVLPSCCFGCAAGAVLFHPPIPAAIQGPLSQCPGLKIPASIFPPTFSP